MKVRVKARNLDTIVFDCPWEGHVADDRIVIRNSAAPNLIGYRCVKCKCLFYELMEQSQIIGPSGEPLPRS